jgi:hypothetical protein
MDRAQGNGNCQTCEFSSMGRFVVRTFRADFEAVREALENLGKIQIARGNKKDEILGIIAVQPGGSGQKNGKAV